MPVSLQPYAACFLVFSLAGCTTKKGQDSSSPTPTPDTGINDDVTTRDSDGDGFPDVADCGPADPTVHPGARELCNRIDDDCDGVPDNNPVDPILLYADADADGFGDPATVFEGCRAGELETTRPDDCDDFDAAVNPDQDEVCWTGKDDDCDGEPGFCGPSGRPTTVALTARWPGAAGDTLGTATAWSLDPRGSGATVLVTGAPNAHGRAGRLLTLHAPLDVADGPVQSWTGDGVDALGTAVRPLGDINEDGFPDLLVGAADARDGRGAALLMAGSLDGWTATDAAVTGTRVGDALGTSMSTGDQDGDGHLDAAFGVPSDITGGLRGLVSVVQGPLTDMTGDARSASALIIGQSPRSATGLDVALDGDVNGDGLADLVVGAPREGAGRVGIFIGPFEGTLALEDADLLYDSDGTAFDIGSAVAWAGDTDADGTDDLLVAAPLGSLNGAVLLFYGDDLNRSTGIIESGAVGAAVLGTQYASPKLAHIGDVNGDGLPDIQAGGPGIHWSPIAGAVEAEEADLLLTPATIDGIRDMPGWLPAAVGPGASPDLNADGLAEVIFAGPALAPSGQTLAGEVQVLSPAGY